MTRFAHPARIAARESGAPTFTSGVPCKKGHATERYTGSGDCIQCARDRASAQRTEKGESYLIEQQAYRVKNSEQRNLQARERRLDPAHKEKVLAHLQAKAAENPEWRKETSRRSYEKHREKIRTQQAESRPRFRGRNNALDRLKKARKIQATPVWADLDAIRQIYTEAAAQGMHVDHIIPLRSKFVCGLHVQNNLQLLEPVENMRKNNSFNPDLHVEPIFNHVTGAP